MNPKGADRIAKSVEPIRLLFRTSLIWVCTVCLSLSVQILRIIMVYNNISLWSIGDNLHEVSNPFF